MTLKEQITEIASQYHYYKPMSPGQVFEVINKLQEIIDLQTKALNFVNASDSALCSSNEARKVLKQVIELTNK